MLAKYWKKIGMLILIIACIFNIMSKLVKRLSFNDELKASAQYMYDEYKDSKEEKKEIKNK